MSGPPAAPMAAAISVALALAVFLTFGRTAWENFDFLRYDDHRYVTANAMVQRGLTWEGILWAFDPRTTVVSNWHPLTMLSHMLDCQLFGLSSWGHHLTSVLWHVANSVLLFWALLRMTSALWPSALVAALFGLHPLHVESVAWISERKDVLSTFFWFLLLWTYTSYVRRPSVGPYLLLMLWLTLGLMSKPMLVTAPLVLLLLDFWPFARLPATAPPGPARLLGRPIVEKLPLLLIALAFAAITWQSQSKAQLGWEAFPLGTRAMNALLSYVAYLGKFIWPTALANPYLISTREITLPRAAACGALLAAITVVCLWQPARRRYLPVGWFWYLVTLAPVIGLVQAGIQSMADRYTYVPLVGIFVMIAWGLGDAVAAWPRLRIPAAAATLVWLLALSILSYQQAGVWRDTVTLFRHAATVTPDNHVAEMHLGRALRAEGQFDEALAAFDRLIALAPDAPQGYFQKGLTYYAVERFPEAAAQFHRAVRSSNGRMKPDLEFSAAYLGARILAAHPDESQRDAAAAIALAEHACQLTGYQQPQALDALGMAYANAGRFDEAIVRATHASELAQQAGAADLAKEIAARVGLYRQRTPYREDPASGAGLPELGTDD